MTKQAQIVALNRQIEEMKQLQEFHIEQIKLLEQLVALTRQQGDLIIDLAHRGRLRFVTLPLR